MSGHPVFDALHKAIMVRQAERANAMEPPLEEIWVSAALYAALYAALEDEAKMLCPYPSQSGKTTICGVEIRQLDARA